MLHTLPFSLGQLRDYQWRLDQEAQANFRLEETRKAMILDIAKSGKNKAMASRRVMTKGSTSKVANTNKTSYLKIQRQRKRVSCGANVESSGQRVRARSPPRLKLPPIKLNTVVENNSKL